MVRPSYHCPSLYRLKQRTYGRVSAVMSGRGKTYVLRGPASPAPSGPGVKDCENRCEALPYKPRDEAKQAIVAAWQALETGVTNHDASAWSPHTAEEFVMLGSTNDHPLTKDDRIATLNLQKQIGFGSAPAPLVSVQMFDFGDAVVMIRHHQPYSGKPVHVSRLWIKRDGHWVISNSYQTTIQAAPPKTS